VLGEHGLPHYYFFFFPKERWMNLRNANNRSRSPSAESEEQGKGSLEHERRGSILSIWRKGKDEHGNHAIVHDDEDWKEYSEAHNLPRNKSPSATRPKQREELPTSSFFA
jgi:hypothetical protein